MRALTAYFVGAGSIVAAIAIGLGGGIVAGNIMHPIAPKQGPDTSKMERQATTGAATSHVPSEHVQYLNGSQAFSAMIAAPAEAQGEAKSEGRSETKPGTPTNQANAEPTTPPAPQTAAVEPEPPKPAAPSPPTQAAKPDEQQASTQPSSSSDNAYAKARDSDAKRAASERRRAERHERWAERRHYEARNTRSMRDQPDWEDVARNIREDSDARDVPSRPRSSFPQIRLFGPDDD